MTSRERLCRGWQTSPFSVSLLNASFIPSRMKLSFGKQNIKTSSACEFALAGSPTLPAQVRSHTAAVVCPALTLK